jgi:hypothetical protein
LNRVLSFPHFQFLKKILTFNKPYRFSFVLRILCVFLFLFPAISFCQIDDSEILHFDSKKYNISKKESEDPYLLVAALTKGKTGDKEKFDAIFGWVATNIRYNYRQYYSSSGSFALPTKYILHAKRVVCLGYANLMDTLCHIAGITNTTVYGYATDEIFDVHDSVFTDNHAWNAVKLDGLWYVYDVTWSTGKMEYKLTRFSRFIQRTLKKHPPKFKQLRIKIQVSSRYKSECATNYKGPAYYYKQRYFNRLLRNILFHFHRKYKKTYIYKIESDYYLCQPELFAIKHCPNDPIWSLGTVKNMQAFENDSAYYYHTDSIYKTQVREGRECPECDAMLGRGAKEKIKVAEKNMYASNNRNRFIIAGSEYHLGLMNYKEALAEPVDSIKIFYLDSAQLNFLTARRNLKAQKSSNAYEIMLQKRKNKKKMSLLLTENRVHRNIVRKKIRLSISNKQSFKRIETKSEAFARGWRQKAYNVSNISTNFKTYPPRKGGEMKAALKKLKLDKTKAEIDTLITHITQLKKQFDSLVQSISLNVWPQAREFDTLFYFFGMRMYMRAGLLDNYKKPVEDMRIKIIEQEFNANNSLDFLLYKPGLSAAALYRTIHKLIRRKNKLMQNCITYERDLVKIEKNPMSDLEEFKAEVLISLKNDYCWLETSLPFVISSNMGFDFLRWQQKEVDLIIPAENDLEKDRTYMVYDILKRRYRKCNNIVDSNQSSVSKKMRMVKNYRVKINRRRK